MFEGATGDYAIKTLLISLKVTKMCGLDTFSCYAEQKSY